MIQKLQVRKSMNSPLDQSPLSFYNQPCCSGTIILEVWILVANSCFDRDYDEISKKSREAIIIYWELLHEAMVVAVKKGWAGQDSKSEVFV
ncbi:unnamed protein product [Allacma fusca]|uniref:Uncharacterized protein n=1 Tax=Allacma fusca TaxID=39272 RepID=A0A8J2LE61_9HEXA|nr:unnamed protein product [Allacma fusca]